MKAECAECFVTIHSLKRDPVHVGEEGRSINCKGSNMIVKHLNKCKVSSVLSIIMHVWVSTTH